MAVMWMKLCKYGEPSLILVLCRPRQSQTHRLTFSPAGAQCGAQPALRPPLSPQRDRFGDGVRRAVREEMLPALIH